MEHSFIERQEIAAQLTAAFGFGTFADAKRRGPDDEGERSLQFMEFQAEPYGDGIRVHGSFEDVAGCAEVSFHSAIGEEAIPEGVAQRFEAIAGWFAELARIARKI